ncbi:oligosaccharide repeat unit polymerase [Escherichia coli]|uniref:oligosaccharide repeat unit polymerase n=2 Tax=Escherichia coli TaxID=562 RepID=UPI001ABBEA1E|nr:oligosaccharide repeat unit polymerase [Escherichia coli]
MSNQEYSQYLFFPNILLFFTIFLLLFLFFIAWFKNNLYSWLDPLLLAILFSSAGVSTVIFLYVLGEIKVNYLLQTVLSQLMLMLGYKILSRRETSYLNKQVKHSTYEQLNTGYPRAFLASSFLFIVAQASTYFLLGIPLLMANRLMIYQEGGFGVLGRIIDATFVISFYTFLDMKVRFKVRGLFKAYGYIYLLFLIISLVLNGSKAGILNLVFIIGIFCYLNKLKFNISLISIYSKFARRLLIFAFISMFIILMVNYGIFSDQNYNRIIDLLGVIFLRIFNSGDIYVLSYPNDALFKIPAEHNGIISLFKDLLATFRIISTNEIPPSLGNIAFNIYSTTEIGGANARQSLFGYYYFGFMGSLLFSFFLGLTMSFFRHVLPRTKKATPLAMGVLCYFILNFSFLDIDPSYQFSKLTNFLIVTPLIILLMGVMPNIRGQKNV